MSNNGKGRIAQHIEYFRWITSTILTSGIHRQVTSHIFLFENNGKPAHQKLSGNVHCVKSIFWNLIYYHHWKSMDCGGRCPRSALDKMSKCSQAFFYCHLFSLSHATRLYAFHLSSQSHEIPAKLTSSGFYNHIWFAVLFTFLSTYFHLACWNHHLLARCALYQLICRLIAIILIPPTTGRY